MGFEQSAQTADEKQALEKEPGISEQAFKAPPPPDIPKDYRAEARTMLISDSSTAEQRAWAMDVWRYEGYEWNDYNAEQSAAETQGILQRSPESRAQKEWRAQKAEEERLIDQAVLDAKRQEIADAEDTKRAQVQSELEAAQPPTEQRWQPEPEEKSGIRKIFGRFLGR
jgi:hypothetical protein